MAQISEIDAIRKKRRRKILIARALLLIALTLAGVGIYLVKDKVKAIDFGGFFGSALVSVQPGSGYPVGFMGEQVKTTYHAGRCLVVLTDSNLMIYNPNGRILRDVQHKYSDPVVRIDGRHILLYDRGGKRLRVESFTDTVAQREFDYPIYAGDISGAGEVAVVTGAQQFNAELAVYDAKLSEQRKFAWKSPDQYIIDVSFSHDNKSVAAATVSASGGDMVCRVRQYRLDREEMQAETEFSGELIHSIECARGGVVAVTDTRTVFVSNSGEQMAEYNYNYESLVAFTHSDDGSTALIFGNYLEDKTAKLVLLNPAAEKLWDRKISSHTILISIDNTRLGLISDGKLMIYNEAGQETSRQSIDSAPLGLNINDKDAYVITPDAIQKLSA